MPRCCTEASECQILPGPLRAELVTLDVCPGRRRERRRTRLGCWHLPHRRSKAVSPRRRGAAVPLGLGALASLDPGIPARQRDPGLVPPVRKHLPGLTSCSLRQEIAELVLIVSLPHGGCPLSLGAGVPAWGRASIPDLCLLPRCPKTPAMPGLGCCSHREAPTKLRLGL